MSRDRTNNKEATVAVKKRKASQKEDKDEEFVKDTKDTVVKKMASKKHKSLSGNKEIKKSSKKGEDTEFQGKTRESRKRSKKEEGVKEEENQAQEDVKDEPQIKKKKGSNKITEDNKVIKENVKGSGSKGKGKQKVDVNGEVKDGDVKDKRQDEGKLDVNKESPQKKKKMKAGDEPVPHPTKYEYLGDGPPSIPSTGRKYMGCHVSGAGGVWNAFENAEECQAKSFALFLRNQRQWMAKPLDEGTIKKWLNASEGFPPHLILPHGSYLMNLGSPVTETLEKSRSMLVEELQRCERLGIPHFNFHPGSTVGKIKREECCKLIAESINLAHSQTKGVICVLENMSCQGFTIGGDFHELRLIIEQVMDKSRVGVCIDTCHAHAAGYDLSTEDGFQELLKDFGNIIGWQFLRGIHMNDSKGKVGDHQDRHENIGHGTIGIEGFQRIMNCEHFNDLPLILETPWTNNKGYGKEIKKLEGLINK